MRRDTLALVLFTVSALSLRAGDDLSVRAYGVMPNGERRPNVKIVREEVERTTLLPLLPYVFFEASSATIPTRYVQFTEREARVFAERQISKIDAYYNLLNIIGRRLTDERTATISLIGSTDGREGADVGRTRALNVRAYLAEVWSIDSSRMTIAARVLPSASTTTKDAELSAQENRRVTIEGPWSIVRPVVVSDTTTTVSPPSVEFQVTTSISNVVGFSIKAWQEDYESPLYQYEHIAVPSQARVWHLDRDPEHQPKSDDDLEYEAACEDERHRQYTSETRAIPVEQVTLLKKKSGEVRGSTELHQYDLILFDFASSALRPDHERIIDSMIAADGYLLPYSTVVVRGYTDSTGSAEINARLSSERAAAAADRVRQRFVPVLAPDAVTSEGIGPQDVLRLPSGLTLPEARMYSRTVHIIVSNKRDR